MPRVLKIIDGDEVPIQTWAIVRTEDGWCAHQIRHAGQVAASSGIFKTQKEAEDWLTRYSDYWREKGGTVIDERTKK